MMTILGLDLGSNSIGWALLEEIDGKPHRIIDLGSRIFTKAVEEKTPTPKNVKRRNARLARRVVQRRARRKQRMLNYLVSLDLLPQELKGHAQPEIILNQLGNPYNLRAKALNEELEAFELGRVLLHLVQRRGFLSNRKTLLSDMIDDPDVLSVLNELDEREDSTEKASEETAFKKDISELRNKIEVAHCRTLGEYLSKLKKDECKRNRKRAGEHLRTDRQMYRDELDLIWKKQQEYHHNVLTDEVREQIEHIIFYQRPLKLKEDRVGKCSLEPKSKRMQVARLEYQRFRYLQDINNLQYFDIFDEQWVELTDDQKKQLKALFETTPTISFARIRRELKLDKTAEFNLEHGNKKLKGNVTACEIRATLPRWDDMDANEQLALVEDLLSFQKKSALKKRLVNHWGYDVRTAVNLCLLEFEPGYGSHSLKAIHKLLPFLEKGKIYSKARQKAGYGYEQKDGDSIDRLGMPPEIPNPIVSRGLHELRRVVNAIIAEYGKPDKIRVEMARDLEMNTKRYKAFEKQQKANTKANESAARLYQEMGKQYPHLHLSKYPSHADKLKYRLWKDQQELCAYSLEGTKISEAELFSANIEIDHILPYSQSLDDSYMNKVVCRTRENRIKGQRTPIDAFGAEEERWTQITQRIARWDRNLKSKKNRFYLTAEDVQKRDFISSQLNDTRYISKVALEYLKPLGADINITKGIMTSWLRYQWQLNSLIGMDKVKKDRVDHRHHTIDALVTACIDRRFYQALVRLSKDLEKEKTGFTPKDIHIDPSWKNLRNDLNVALQNMIVSHTPQRKITGSLHEETGTGFVEGVGTVYRATLSPEFKMVQIKKIIDPEVREIVMNHLASFGNNPKEAFTEGVSVYHKDGKTPIKRVRIVQSKTIRKKLDGTKFGVKNKQGEVFRWMAYGNMHHVEIVQNKDTGAHKSKFVTMKEAHRRAMTGTKSARKRGVIHEPIIQADHGEEYKYIMALHINDLVSIETDDGDRFYRVQKLESDSSRITLRLHTAATIKITYEEIRLSITGLMQKNMKKHAVNAIGKLMDD